MAGFAWVTLATNDSYSLGALVLAHSLRRVGSKHDLAVLVTPGVTGAMREKLASVFSLVQEVNVLDSKDEANLALLARPELGITFTKLHCWRLTQYEKCVFVDADTLVIRNCDELFEREELSAAPDVGWPDCFNSGVFVFKPSQQTFASITAFAAAKGSFDGGDQGLLNQYFSDWAHKDISKHLPFIYNMCSTATYSYLPAFKQFGEDVRIIHFIGITKPWLQYFDTVTGQVQPAPGSNHLQPLLQLWWHIFCENVHPQLSPVMAGIAGALAKITLGEARSPEQLAFEEHMRKQSWEQGQIDYMGRDSFDNIWKKISETLGVQSQRQPSPPKTLPKPEESEAAVATPVATEDQPAAKKSEAAVPAEPREKEEQDLTRSDAKVAPQTSQIEPSKITTEAAKIPPQSPISSDAAMNPVALAAIVPQVPTATPEKSSADHPAASTPTALDSSIKQVAEILLRDVQDSSEFSSKASEAAAAISPAEDKKSASEKDMKIEQIVSDSPVPIQVAESVLEAEVKESVTEDLRPVTEEAISSISVSAQESVLETVMQAAVAPTASTPNGAAVLDPISEIGNGIDALSLSTPARMEENLPVVQPQATPEAARREETSAVQAARLETPEVETEAQKSEAVLAEVGREAAEVATETQKSDTVLAEICQKAAEVATETQKSDTVLAEIGGKAAEVTTETPQTLVAVEAAAAKPLEREESKVSPVESQEALPKEPETSVLASVKSLEKPEEPKILTEAEKLSSIAAEATKKPQEEAELLVKSESSSSPVEVSVKTEDTKVSAKLEEPAEKIAEIQPSKSEESAACPMKPKTAASTKPEEKSSSLPVAEAKTAEIQPSKSEESAACPIKPKTATPTKPEEKSSSLPVVETKTAEIQPSKSEESAACPIKPKTAPPTKPKEKSSSPPVVEAKTTEIQPSKSEESAACPIKPKTAVSTKPEEKSSLPVADSKTAEESAACPLKPKIATSTKPEETKPAEKPATKPKVPKDESKESETSEDLVSQSESSEESPVRPARTKEQQIIPGTPIVTEATPPTSPPIGAVETFGEQPAQPAKTTKKVVKKVTKKTTTTTSAEKPADGAEGTTTEGETKKVTKKVVKKVAKKTKDEDGAEASGTTEKPKKIVKVVKKTTKVGQTLEADATAPETPPPGATEVPVPPKRKLKTVAKSTPAKTETEP